MKLKAILPFIVTTVCLIVILKISVYSEKSEVQSAPDTLIANFDHYVSDFLNECGAPGIAIAIVKDGKIVYIKTFGVRETGKPDKINEHTVFRIASLSKGFAAVLTGLLMQKGYLNWDDPVITFLKDFSLKDSLTTQKLTIRHLLSHTTGLVHHAYDNLLDAKIPFNKIIPRLEEVYIFAPVGEYYSYQNTVFSLIDPIIEKATGIAFKELLKDSIFIPLGMKNASCDLAGLLADSNYAAPHIHRRNKWLTIKMRGKYYSVTPAAGINASIHDMALWLHALSGKRPEVIPLAVIDEIAKSHIKTPFARWRYNWRNHVKSASYGLGWRVLDYEGKKLVYHSGGVRGYLAKIGFLPDYQTGIVLLANSSFKNNFFWQFINRYLNARNKQLSSSSSISKK